MFQSLRSLLFSWVVFMLLAIMWIPSSAQMNAPDPISSTRKSLDKAKLRAPSLRVLPM